MKLLKSLIFVLSLAGLATASAFAGEDSSHRWHCNGAPYYDMPGGLQSFDHSMSDCGASPSAPA